MKLTKSFWLAALISFATYGLNAQSEYEEGQIDVNLGVGLIPTFGLGDVGLPLSVSVDYGFREEVGPGDVGIGGYIGYSGSTDNDPNFGDVTRTYVIVGVRGTYHIDLIEGVDTYAGLLAAFNVATVSVENNPAGFNIPSAGGGAGYSLFAGGRYYFTDNLGVFAEVGYGISIINGGLSVKF